VSQCWVGSTRTPLYARNICSYIGDQGSEPVSRIEPLPVHGPHGGGTSSRLVIAVHVSRSFQLSQIMGSPCEIFHLEQKHIASESDSELSDQLSLRPNKNQCCVVTVVFHRSSRQRQTGIGVEMQGHRMALVGGAWR